MRESQRHRGTTPIDDVVAPGADHATPRAALETMLDAYQTLRSPGDEGWLTFVANEDDETTVQVLGPTINLVRQPLDLAALLCGAGEDALADAVSPRGLPDVEGEAGVTLWEVLPASTDTLAAILDLVFADGRGLGRDYRLHGSFESSEAKAPGPLGRSITTLSLAGWLLLAVACASIALVAFVIGPWVLDLVGLSRWRQRLPIFLDVLMIPGLVAGILVYLLGHRVLARAGISTQRAPPAPKSTV